MCLDMNKMLLTLLLFTSCSGEQFDYSWFEDEWVSDADASIAINPEYADFNDNDLQSIREIYGQIKWTISGSTIEFYDLRTSPTLEWSADLDIAAIDAQRFQMNIEGESRIIWKTDNGFCTMLDPGYLLTVGIEGEMLGLECFEPAGT